MSSGNPGAVRPFLSPGRPGVSVRPPPGSRTAKAPTSSPTTARTRRPHNDSLTNSAANGSIWSAVTSPTRRAHASPGNRRSRRPVASMCW